MTTTSQETRSACCGTYSKAILLDSSSTSLLSYLAYTGSHANDCSQDQQNLRRLLEWFADADAWTKSLQFLRHEEDQNIFVLKIYSILVTFHRPLAFTGYVTEGIQARQFLISKKLVYQRFLKRLPTLLLTYHL